MKRSTAKKTTRPIKEEEIEDNSAWFDVMRATLNPYWSARVERTTPRVHQRDEEAA